jgi:2-polyprenyl-3-methyl-5-hydroxy-6-metoxy-1,4-benzoquinol methylase
MSSDMQVSIQVVNFEKVDRLLNVRKFSSGRLDFLKFSFPHAVSIEICEQTPEWETPDGTIAFFSGVPEGITITTDFSYPFFDLSSVADAMAKFIKSGASYLVTHNPRGEAIPALIISKEFESFSSAKHDCFPYMITDKEAFQCNSSADKEKYLHLFGQEKFIYSDKVQLEAAIKYKDNLGDYYGKDVSHDPVLARSARDAPQRIDVLLKIPTGLQCLDVGCSCGIITAKLAEAGKKMTGVEIVPQLYEEAENLKRTLPHEISQNLTYINSPIEKCEFTPDYFDAVYMTETFEHIPHFVHRELFEKIIHYLKPAGSVVFSVPNRYPSQKYVDEGRHRWDWFNHVTHYTAKSVEDFLSSYFETIIFHAVYDEPVNEGIFLICEARGKK